MSTRSRIGKQNENGSISSIYCHHDGYLAHVGTMLNEHYNTPEKVDELLKLGDISSLYENLNPLEIAEEAYSEPVRMIKTHSFRKAQKDVTVAYHRDRGDALNRMNSATESDYVKLASDSDAAYIYLFKNNEWHVSTYGKFSLLADALKTIKA